MKFNISRLFVVDSKGFEPSTSRMRTERSRNVVSFLPTDCGVWFDENAGRGATARNTIPQFFNKAGVDSDLYAGKIESYFFTMTNLLLTRKDGLVYNGNNSSGKIFLESYCYLLTVTKEVKE